MKMSEIVAIIPARGGSKRILNKNIKFFHGKPVINYAIDLALASGLFDRILVSTDDEAIARIARKAGAEVPFMRPEHLADDEASGFSVLNNLLENIPEAEKILTLQPTSPLRRVEDIKGILNFFKSSNTESVVSLTKANKHPSWMFNITSTNKMIPITNEEIPSCRQKLNDAYVLNGSLYLGTRNFYIKEKKMLTKNTLGYIMPKEISIDIDDELDWEIAETIFKRGLN